MDTQDDVEEIKETIDKIDQRLYDIQSKQRQYEILKYNFTTTIF